LPVLADRRATLAAGNNDVLDAEKNVREIPNPS
jgi:hypothetical protein